MDNNLHIAVFLPLSDKQKRRLEAAAPMRRFVYGLKETVSADMLEGAEIIIGNPPISLLKYARNLKWFQTQTAGVDDVLSSGVVPKHVIITNARSAFSEAQAEFMLSVLLLLMKKLLAYRDNQQKHIWQDEGLERMVTGSCALVVGMGEIGSAFSRKLRALGAYTIGICRTNKKRKVCTDELHTIDKLDTLLPRADIVSLVLPATKETTGMFNATRFANMKQGAFFLNMGRGSTVDTEALCDALESGSLNGAGIDVVHEEPLSPQHRLWRMPNTILTPHIAGHDFLPMILEKTLQISIQNLSAYVRDNKLINIIDRTLGYNP